MSELRNSNERWQFLADQMEVTGLTVGMLEPESPFAEVHLAGNARIDHPLERAINRGTTDPVIVPPDQINEVVSTEMPFLPQEDVDNLLPLAERLPPVGFSRLRSGRAVKGNYLCLSPLTPPLTLSRRTRGVSGAE